MQTIKYRFADGTTSEIEVTDEFYTLYAELVQQEKRNHWKETRRHISLDYLNENGIDFESPAADPLSVLLRSEDEERIHSAINQLSDKQVEFTDGSYGNTVFYGLLNCKFSDEVMSALRTATNEVGEENVFKVGILKTDNAISNEYVECDTWYKLGLDVNTVYMATENISLNQGGFVF